MTGWLRALLLGRCCKCGLPLVLRRRGWEVWAECPAFRTVLQRLRTSPPDYRDSRLLTAAEMWGDDAEEETLPNGENSGE